jgi:hypothetical protein
MYHENNGKTSTASTISNPNKVNCSLSAVAHIVMTDVEIKKTVIAPTMAMFNAVSTPDIACTRFNFSLLMRLP